MDFLAIVTIWLYLLVTNDAVAYRNDVNFYHRRHLWRKNDPSRSNRIIRRRVLNMRGPAGPMGPRGPKGDPGDVTQCECDMSGFEELKNEVNRLTKSCLDGLIFDNQCIRLAYTQGRGVDFYEAESICESLSSRLVEITSDLMYRAVYSYVKSRWIQYIDIKWNSVDVWLGSTFQPINNPNHVITLTNGTTVNLTNWHPWYPKHGYYHSLRTKLIMTIRTRDSSSRRGIWNNIADIGSAVPLCVYLI